MKHNARENLILAHDELCSCQNHLNKVFMQSDSEWNKTELRAAIKSVADAIDSAKNSILHYED